MREVLGDDGAVCVTQSPCPPSPSRMLSAASIGSSSICKHGLATAGSWVINRAYAEPGGDSFLRRV